MWDWLSEAFSWLGGKIADFFVWLWSCFESGWDAVLAWLEDLWTLGVDWFMSALPPGLVDWFQNWSGWPFLGSAWRLVTYFIPLGTMLAMCATAITLAALIRLVRWVKSFIPTIGD